jgi:phage FluMu protein Com
MKSIKRFWTKLNKRFTATEEERLRKAKDLEEMRIWDKIANKRCPDCSSLNQLGVVATGGIALNIRCFACNSLFWASPERAFGAKRLQSGSHDQQKLSVLEESDE